MKPFLLIAGDDHYPSAYDGDWVACFSTREEALACVKIISNEVFITYRDIHSKRDWYDIIDLRKWMNKE